MLTVPPTGLPSTSKAASSNDKPDALGDRQALVAAGIVEHDGEFLAAEAADQIARAELGAGGLGKDLQHAVADGMAEAVVDQT